MVEARLRALALVVIAAAALFAVVLRLDLGDLPEVTRFRDDAYYYFTWVRSLIEGRGPTISEDSFTSGVHPLWCLVLVLPGLLVGSASLPVAAQLLGLTLHAGTAALLAAGPGRGSRGGLVVGLVYLGNPFLLAEAQNGQETALACFAALLVWQLRQSIVPFMVASALAVLARSDLFGVVLGLSLWRYGFALRTVFVPIAALLPLFAFNLAVGGEWMQDSARPIPWLFRENFLAGDPDLGAHLQRLWWYLRPCLLGGPFALVSPWWMGVYVFIVLRGGWPRRLRIAPLVGTIACWILGAQDVAVPLIASILLIAAPASGRRAVPWDLIALGVGLWLLVAAHEVWRQYPRNYYFAPVGIAGALALLPLARGRWHWFLVPLALGQAFTARAPVTEQRPWQEEMAMAGRLLDRVLGPEELVGCFNAGLVTWYRPDRVVNLDGRVNRAAFRALQARELSRYLDERGTRFVLDTPVQFALRDPWPHASGSYFGDRFDPQRDLQEVVRFEIPGVGGGIVGTDSFRLYWRVGSGLAPRLESGFADLGPAPGGGRYLRWSGAEGEVLELGPLAGPEVRETIVRGEAGVVFVLLLRAPGADPVGVFASGEGVPLLTLKPL